MCYIAPCMEISACGSAHRRCFRSQSCTTDEQLPVLPISAPECLPIARYRQNGKPVQSNKADSGLVLALINTITNTEPPVCLLQVIPGVCLNEQLGAAADCCWLITAVCAARRWTARLAQYVAACCPQRQRQNSLIPLGAEHPSLSCCQQIPVAASPID